MNLTQSKIKITKSTHPKLQCMADKYYAIFKHVGLDINFNKSACMRVGKRHNAKLADITANGKIIPWCNQMDYLGVQLTSALTFTVNLQKPRQKFFAALNSIFGKVGPNSSPAIILSLIEAQCVPILLYASECIGWKKSLIESLENTLYQTYFIKCSHI